MKKAKINRYKTVAEMNKAISAIPHEVKKLLNGKKSRLRALVLGKNP